MSENRPPSSSHDCRVWEKDGKQMLRVPGGEFLYGADRHKLSLPEFWIDRTPVTVSNLSGGGAVSNRPRSFPVNDKLLATEGPRR